MKYTAKYFYDNMPKWKRIKDTFYCRFLLRPLSFYISSFFANIGITANTASYLNVFIAIFAGVLLLFNNYTLSVVGGIMISVWLLFDCVDGNLARSVRKQPYGEYADALSSYFLVPLVCFGVGCQTYYNGGLFFEKECFVIIIASFFIGLSDTMMRLVYHKYKEVTNHMIKLGAVTHLDDSRNDHSKTGSLKVKIEADGGIAGVVPIITLVGLIFNLNDISLFYLLCYYSGSFVVTTLMYTYKAIQFGKQTIIDPDDKDQK